ncbi:hypothetical protein LSAT2_001622 [Lamellibrachia satsuma]|nr:hypothetical protein LSAT2_001622 [Lamellibrachia satsuma]
MEPMKVLCCAALLCCLSTVRGDRVKERIYKDVQAYSLCVRLLNGTHQIGCNSKRGGNVGTVHVIANQSDIDWMVKHGPHAPYVVLLNYHSFTRDIMDTLRKSGKVNGIILPVLNETERPDYLSPDQSCPNVGSEMYKNESNLRNCRNVTWNEHGSGLMFEDFNIPIVKLQNGSDVDFIKKCYRDFNEPSASGAARSYPLCAMQLKVAMDAAKDTPTCIRRSSMITNLNPQVYCDALGDRNVYSFLHLHTVADDLKNKSVIMAAARLDAFSMFLASVSKTTYNSAPGADSTVTGLVTLLAVAEAIGKVKEDISKTDRPIMFTFFNGESFDYIGSSRMLYEMQKNNFPAERDPDFFSSSKGKKWSPSQDEPHSVNLEHLYALVELSQVGLGSEIWIHSDPVSRSTTPEVDAQVKNMTSLLKKAAFFSGAKMNSTPTGQPLPPASLQTFLKEKHIPGLLLTDHKASYSNKYYNGHLDGAHQLGPEGSLSTHLTILATAVAQMLYQMSTGKEHTGIAANESTVSGLLHCFLKTTSCDMFLRTYYDEQSTDKPSDAPYPLYVSVSRPGRINIPTVHVRNLLAYFLGDRVPDITSVADCKKADKEEKKADKSYTYLWMPGELVDSVTRDSFCLKTIANYSVARSPAFDIDDYDWSSQKYSTWSESVWGNDALQVRIFLVPSKEREIAILCGGIGFFLLSTAGLFLVRRKFDVIFDSDE